MAHIQDLLRIDHVRPQAGGVSGERVGPLRCLRIASIRHRAAAEDLRAAKVVLEVDHDHRHPMREEVEETLRYLLRDAHAAESSAGAQQRLRDRRSVSTRAMVA
jgi:hypothetical protein